MAPRTPRHDLSPEPNERWSASFADKLKILLPDVEFEEPAEMSEARTAVLEALTGSNQDSDFLRRVWLEYREVCEQILADKSDLNPQSYAHLQIVMLVHKALIFREAKDIQRYVEDSVDAETYAYNMHFDKITQAIDAELDDLCS